MKGFPLRLDVFRDNPKYPMLIAILTKKEKNKIAAGFMTASCCQTNVRTCMVQFLVFNLFTPFERILIGCFFFFSKYLQDLQDFSFHSYEQKAWFLVLRKNGLQIVKENKAHHRRRHISVMHLMFWDFIISSMVYLLLGSIDCKREAHEHRTTQIFYSQIKLGLAERSVWI